jgi:hypothetical protein
MRSAYQFPESDHNINWFNFLIPLSGPRIDLATTTLAQWLFLRCHTQYRPLRLHISVFTYIPAQILDSRGDVISMFQSYLLVVRSREHLLPSLQLLRSLTSGVSSLQGNYYIAFIILSDAMEDPSFKLNGIHVLNVILEYFYVGLLLMCFILALGNRPQGSKLGYTLAFIGFALITIYMTVSPIFFRA